MKIITILKKNLKILLRNPLSSLIIILGPLLLVLLLGFSFGSSSDVLLKASTYSVEYSPLAQETLDVLSAGGTQITRQTTMDDCLRAVHTGEHQLCIEFPPGFSTQNNAQITFHVDSSQINLVGYVLDRIKGSVEEKSAAISTSYSADVLDRLTFAREQLEVIAKSVENTKSSSQNASSDVATSLSKVESINVEFGIDAASITQASTDVTSADLAASDLYDSIDLDIDEMESNLLSLQEDIEDALDAAQGTSAEDDLEAINESVVSLLEDIEVMRNDTDSNYTNASAYLTNAQVSLSSMSSKIAGLDEQIAAAVAAQSAASASLANAQKSIDALKTDIETISSAVNSAITRIGSVDLSAREISAPIETRIQAINSSQTNFAGMFPTLIVLITMITSILLGATLTFSEKSSRAHLRNLLTPTSPLIFNIGTFLTAAALILVQTILFFAVSTALFKVGITPNLYVVLLALIAVSAVFVLIGMILGYAFKTQETTTLAAVTISALLMFFSNTFVPLASMPELMQAIAKYSPFVVAENIIRQILVFDLSISAVYIPLGIVVGYIAVFYGLFAIVQKSASRFSKVHIARAELGLAGRIGLASRAKTKKNAEVKKEDAKEANARTSEVPSPKPEPAKQLPPAPKPEKVEDSNLPDAPAPVVDVVEKDQPRPLFADEEPEPLGDEVVEEAPVSDFEARLAEINRLLGE